MRETKEGGVAGHEASMCTIDYSRYINVQLKWAVVLITRAEEIQGYEAGALRAKGLEVLADVRRLMGREATARPI